MRIRATITILVFSIVLFLPAFPATADTVRLLSTPLQSATARVDMILGARDEIIAEYFIVGDDPFSLTSLTLLRDAARRGITVKLIIDAQWNKMPKAVTAHLIKEGVELRIYHPFRPGRPGWFTRRLHDKLLVVDDRGLEMAEALLDAYEDWLDIQVASALVASAAAGPAILMSPELVEVGGG